MRFLDAFLNFLFPVKCLLCHKDLLHAQGLCDVCFLGMEYISPPICLKCGIPFPSDVGRDHLCGNCLTSGVHFGKARAVGHYKGTMQEAIHQFKHKKKVLLAGPLGALMADYDSDEIDFESYDLLIPVPLHFKRLRERGFNQALSLARSIGRKYEIPIDYTGLKRIRWVEPQTNLKMKERKRNVMGAFYISDRHREMYEGKSILLIDDVYTSGATVNECSKVLMNAGTSGVDVLTLCRAV